MVKVQKCENTQKEESKVSPPKVDGDDTDPFRKDMRYLIALLLLLPRVLSGLRGVTVSVPGGYRLNALQC